MRSRLLVYRKYSAADGSSLQTNNCKNTVGSSPSCDSCIILRPSRAVGRSRSVLSSFFGVCIIKVVTVLSTLSNIGAYAVCRYGLNRVVRRICLKSRRIRFLFTRPANGEASYRLPDTRRTSSSPCKYRAAFPKSTGSPAAWRCCASSTTNRV